MPEPTNSITAVPRPKYRPGRDGCCKSKAINLNLSLTLTLNLTLNLTPFRFNAEYAAYNFFILR